MSWMLVQFPWQKGDNHRVLIPLTAFNCDHWSESIPKQNVQKSKQRCLPLTEPNYNWELTYKIVGKRIIQHFLKWDISITLSNTTLVEYRWKTAFCCISDFLIPIRTHIQLTLQPNKQEQALVCLIFLPNPLSAFAEKTWSGEKNQNRQKLYNGNTIMDKEFDNPHPLNPGKTQFMLQLVCLSKKIWYTFPLTTNTTLPKRRKELRLSQ